MNRTVYSFLIFIILHRYRTYAFDDSDTSPINLTLKKETGADGKTKLVFKFKDIQKVCPAYERITDFSAECEHKATSCPIAFTFSDDAFNIDLKQFCHCALCGYKKEKNLTTLTYDETASTENLKDTTEATTSTAAEIASSSATTEEPANTTETTSPEDIGTDKETGSWASTKDPDDITDTSTTPADERFGISGSTKDPKDITEKTTSPGDEETDSVMSTENTTNTTETTIALDSIGTDSFVSGKNLKEKREATTTSPDDGTVSFVPTEHPTDITETPKTSDFTNTNSTLTNALNKSEAIEPQGNTLVIGLSSLALAFACIAFVIAILKCYRQGSYTFQQPSTDTELGDSSS